MIDNKKLWELQAVVNQEIVNSYKQQSLRVEELTKLTITILEQINFKNPTQRVEIYNRLYNILK